jgi:hypothetical protein
LTPSQPIVGARAVGREGAREGALLDGSPIPGQNVGFVLYGYYGCPAGVTEGCQPGPHRLRVVVWDSTQHGPIPEGAPALYDNRAGTSFDLDQANPQTVNQGLIQIQHPPIQ